MNTPQKLNLAVIGLMFLGGFAIHAHLPATIPVHFGGNGKPTEWGANSLLFWLVFPLIATTITLLMFVSAKFAQRSPQQLNVPNKAKFMALPPEKQAIVMKMVLEMFDWIGALTTLTLALVQWGIYLAIQTSNGNLILYAIVPAEVFVVVFIFRFVGKITEEIEQQSRSY